MDVPSLITGVLVGVLVLLIGGAILAAVKEAYTRIVRTKLTLYSDMREHSDNNPPLYLYRGVICHKKGLDVVGDGHSIIRFILPREELIARGSRRPAWKSTGNGYEQSHSFQLPRLSEGDEELIPVQLKIACDEIKKGDRLTIKVKHREHSLECGVDLPYENL